MNSYSLNERFLLLQFSLPRQLEFLEDLLRLMSDGVAAREALRLTQNTGLPISQTVAEHMLSRLREGQRLSSCMKNLFRPDVVSAAAAAEASTNFVRVAQRVVQHLREQWDARQSVSERLLRPIFYLAIAAILYAMFASMIWPRFEDASAVEDWHFLARINYAIGQFLLSYWEIILAALALFAGSLRVILERWTVFGRRYFDRLWPMALYRELSAARAMEYLGTMLVAGMDVRTALANVIENASPHSRLYLREIHERLHAGHNVAHAMDVGLLTEHDTARLKLLAEHQELYDVMLKMALQTYRSVQVRLKTMAGVFDVTGLVIVAIAYAALVGSLYLNASSLVGGLQQTLGF